MYRHHPSWVAACEVVRPAGIGRLRAVQSWFSYYNDDPANIRNMLDAGGGALFDIGCYSVNLSRMLFGAEPTAVQASIMRDPATGVDTLTSAILEFDGRRRDVHLLDPGRDRPAGPRLRHRGPPVDRDPVQHPARPADPRLRHRRRRSAGRPAIETLTFPTADPYTAEAERFAAAILDGTPTPTPPEDAVANLRVIERIFAAGNRGRARDARDRDQAPGWRTSPCPTSGCPTPSRRSRPRSTPRDSTAFARRWTAAATTGWSSTPIASTAPTSRG